MIFKKLHPVGDAEFIGSEPSHTLRNCDKKMAENETKKKVIFAVGNKRIIFSDSAFPTFAEELESLYKDEDHHDDDGNESDPPSAKASTTLPDSNSNSFFSSSSKAIHLDSDSDNQWHGFLKKIKKGSTSFHPSLHSIKRLTRKKSRKLSECIPDLPQINMDAELHCFEASWKNFSLEDLESATNNFSREYLIGEGGYSEVYKGHLEDGQLIAVKRLTRGGMHLVLPLSHHGSLASLLSGHNNQLEWGVRFNIAIGAASGLSYLHEGCQRRIIHRDIKAANVLLSEDFEPKISDFGLAKWLPDQWMHLTVSQLEGTFGYLAPEIFMNGLIDEKTDVYAFGVLLLEIITGRPAVDESQHSLVMWAKPLIASKNFQELLDPQLSGACDLDQLNCIVSISSLCINHIPTERPKMSQVYRMLNGDEGILNSKRRFLKRTAFRRGSSVELYAEDYDPEDLLQPDDLNQQNQIALEL
ncbi:unnamed protein product [Lactuca virosa]|uniref:non-specific serine/threonine protein kinase n=1 Tax=Lactuca virosa TaxID=75947 RepID=A0AAU9LRF4_9ASTR|nr:unnamed protein product [Lactuca virosa]